jgi:predicted PhzF superfamily epimerase YddE/YHI9
MASPASVPIYVVDAFTDRPFSGNPAAVCLLAAWPADSWLHKVAAEMNLSETAFLVPNDSGFDLRWLTPQVEVDLCGHATLASAFVLWHAGKASFDEPIAFHTRSGTLTAARRGEAIELDFPLQVAAETVPPPGLLEALGARATFIGKGSFDYLVEVESEKALRALSPDFRKLASVPVRGVIVTARSSRDEFDFVSRFFAPASGIDEDPVTGSAHCTLASHWCERTGKSTFRAYQASARGGSIGVRIEGQRVLLTGRAVLVVEGQLLAGN